MVGDAHRILSHLRARRVFCAAGLSLVLVLRIGVRSFVGTVLPTGAQNKSLVCVGGLLLAIIRRDTMFVNVVETYCGVRCEAYVASFHIRNRVTI